MIDNLDADRRTFGPERQLHDVIRGELPVGVLDSVAGGSLTAKTTSPAASSITPSDPSQRRTCERIDAS